MEYEVGQKVRIKSLDWYNENKDERGEIRFENGIFTNLKSLYLGYIMTVAEITLENQYIFHEDKYQTLWTDEMIEGLVEEEIREVVDEHYWDMLGGESKNEFTLPDGYQFKDENGNVINATKIILEKKKKEYPKTYEECCEIIHSDPKFYVDTHLYSGILETLYKLLICRDAYWQITGEEMGLGKPWTPDWGNPDHDSYPTITRCGGKIIRTTIYTHDCPFSFPTEEMRDAFYENFKELIEQCKELL